MAGNWFMRGVQSAIFHYLSCAPCTGYMYKKRRRKQAKRDQEAHAKLHSEQPELYHHPLPTGTNPYWNEEIAMGPGPPPRRAKRSNTTNSSTKGIITGGTHSTVVSQTGSSIDIDQGEGNLRLSDDTLDDDNWNRKRYQREDEDLWGFGEPASLTRTGTKGSSIGFGGITRPGTKSSTDSYYTVRAPPVNDLHPPIVSMPSPNPSDNHWMLQPPPKASIMAGKERATHRSRSGSGASSRVELSLQRQVSTRQLQLKLERGETVERQGLSRGSSHADLVGSQRPDRPKTPQVQIRPPSASSSRKKKKKRRDTAFTTLSATSAVSAKTEVDGSSGESSENLLHTKCRPRRLSGANAIPPVPFPIAEVAPPKESPSTDTVTRYSPRESPVPSLKIVRVRSSHQRLSTVISSGSGNSPDQPYHERASENCPSRRPHYSSTQSSDSVPYLMKHRSPLTSSDISSLNVLQDLVTPRALLNSRFVSAPLVEARIKLPPSDIEEETTLNRVASEDFTGSGFGVSRGWGAVEVGRPVPFDSLGVPARDPRLRWSVDF